MNSTAFRKPNPTGSTVTIQPLHTRRAQMPAPELHTLAVLKLQALGLSHLATKLVVIWNPRMRSTAGLAYPTTTQIVLNPKLQIFGAEEVERTLLHELAHLIAHHRGGRRRIAPHGVEWRLACTELGLNNEARCHNLPLPRRKMARTCVYQCPNCKTELARVRAFRRAAACMSCCRSLNAGRYDERFKLVKLPYHNV